MFGALAAGVTLGATVPVVLSSRGESDGSPHGCLRWCRWSPRTRRAPPSRSPSRPRRSSASPPSRACALLARIDVDPPRLWRVEGATAREIVPLRQQHHAVGAEALHLMVHADYGFGIQIDDITDPSLIPEGYVCLCTKA
jgi:hypothetical protein